MSRTKIMEAIVQELDGFQLTPIELAALTGQKVKAIKKALKGLENKGDVVLSAVEGEDEVWCLVEFDEITITPVKKLEPITLQLAHCGEFTIDEDEINGWFHPIPMSLWRQIIGFHKTMSIETNSETVSYHRWNTTTEQYDTIIPYQVTTRGGLSVDTDWESKENVALLDDYAKDTGQEFFPACTIHTHVDTGAFESGTDAADEEDQPGWHITLGHLSKNHASIDMDTRFRVNKIKMVKDRTSVTTGYDLPMIHLFEEGVTKEEIVTCPWDDQTFNQYKKRVSFNQRGLIGVASRTTTVGNPTLSP